MPKNLPTAAEAWEKVIFFSIDTNLIQAAGYNFTQGALHQLPNQLPEAIGLQLPEIVVSEIVDHQMKSVYEHHDRLQQAAEKLQRLTTIDTTEVQNAVEKLNAVEVAIRLFTQQVHDYATRCRGAVLPTAGETAVTSLFADYFSKRPPFGLSEKKKSEFPDAMCLWQLEKYAEDNDTIGIIASDDKGWKQYAADSDRLYCADSLDELTALFAATNDHAESIKAKIVDSIMDDRSPLAAALSDALDQHIANAQWDSMDVYSGSAQRIESEVYDAKLDSYSIQKEDTRVWFVQGEPTTLVVELTMTAVASIDVSVEFFAWDSIDREEVGLGSQTFNTEEEVTIDVFLTCSNVHLDTEQDTWDTDIEIANGTYSIEGFEAELDYGLPDE